MDHQALGDKITTEHAELLAQSEDQDALCGVENPNTHETCVLSLDHLGHWHMDGNDREWYGKPSGIAWD